MVTDLEVQSINYNTTAGMRVFSHQLMAYHSDKLLLYWLQNKHQLRQHRQLQRRRLCEGSIQLYLQDKFDFELDVTLCYVNHLMVY